MHKTYHWIGGSTGSTLASRFDWNVASNWRTVTDNFLDPTEPIIQIPSESPSGYDTVIIGGYYNSRNSQSGETLISFTALSPLLFGGFSGTVGNGGWDDSTYGATGTTYTSTLLEMHIKGSKSKENFNDVNYKTNYPFRVIGGGITASTHWFFTTYTSLVSGMTQIHWDYLLANANNRQKEGLKVKTANLNIEIDESRYLLANSYTFDQRPMSIELQLVDNYGTSPSDEDIITSVDMNCVNTQLKLKNSKVITINFEQPLIWWPHGGINSAAYKNFKNSDRCLLNLEKCTVEEINTTTFLQTITDRNCLIGKYKFYLKSYMDGGKGFVYNPDQYAYTTNPIYSYHGGTYDDVLAALALRKNPILSGITVANIDVDLTKVTNFFKTSDPIIYSLGDQKAPNTTFTCGSISINNPTYVNHKQLRIESIVSIKVEKIDVRNTLVDFFAKNKSYVVRNLILRTGCRFKATDNTWSTNQSDVRIGEIYSNNNIFGGIITENPISIDSNTGRYSGQTFGSIITADSKVYFVTYGVDGIANNRNDQFYDGINDIVGLNQVNDGNPPPDYEGE